MADSPTLSREINYDATVVFVDGITRTGKSMMGPILASFDRVEIERVEEIFEYVGVLYRLGKVPRDAAVAMLKMETDMQIYNSMIGRNTNFRFGDHSGVWRNPRRLRYFRRLFAPEGDTVVRRIAVERPIYQNQTHDQLANFELYHEAFGDRFRIIEMIRHPVDLVDSWLRRGWGRRFGTDPRALKFCIRYEGQDLPYYALGWEKIYLHATPVGRVIRMIAGLWDSNLQAYRSLTPERKKVVLMISFEDFVQHPTPYLQPIANFLGTETTRHTRPALKRQKCPRRYSEEARMEKQRRIEAESSPEELRILERLIGESEELVGSYTLVSAK